jgi:hypothetical protein
MAFDMSEDPMRLGTNLASNEMADRVDPFDWSTSALPNTGHRRLGLAAFCAMHSFEPPSCPFAPLEPLQRRYVMFRPTSEEKFHERNH